METETKRIRHLKKGKKGGLATSEKENVPQSSAGC